MKIAEKVSRSLAALVLIAVPVNSMAASPVGANLVISSSIKPADGTTGQSLTTGSGVKTGHIQNAAVTDAKIANEAVTNAKLAAGAVTDDKISGMISGAKLGIHNHPVSDITGIFPVAQLPVGTTTDSVSAGNHTHDGIYQKRYANVIVVAKNGGDFTDPVAAVNSITDASAINPYLVKIMPGVYDLPAALRMKSNVDVEGSGENATKLAGAFDNGVVQFYFANTAELRSLTVESNGKGSAYSVNSTAVNVSACSYAGVRNVTAKAFNGPTQGIYIENATEPKFHNVTVIAAGESSNVGVKYFVYDISPLVIENMNVTASGGTENFALVGFRGGDMPGAAIVKNSTLTAKNGSNQNVIVSTGTNDSLTLVNITGSASGGNYNYGVFGSNISALNIVNSTLNASYRLMENNQSVNIVNSQLIGGPILPVTTNSVKCMGVYDGNYNPYVCP